ncbi:hemerythrin domain-containing protein [Luteipulveratus mongoliensis]|uniref:Hemerythrin-like domain-containing protein n=1 Tax=Luteipulveratus mongoliensis TaxID=571913 RepID=A0A0K1JEE1_9MICO|nr:hemerythrin domain-containing protein [Luteipulveratus mongoliensis]AKU15082.1 hypothetical protein VV02_03080 [Luteipulveratus mongoliensis]
MTTETPEQARQRRAPLRGRVDFTMMYVAHDAFNRDLDRLTRAAERGDGFTSEAEATWRMFSKQLHTHHTAEDTALWPPLRDAVAETDLTVLDAMEDEHAQIDPRLEAVDAAFADRDSASLGRELRALATGLALHMRHEEEAALPLLERTLGAAGWAAFAARVRDENGGIRGGAQYLPWVLDGASDEMTRAVLAILPAPARVIYRRRWAPRYRKSGLLT